MPLTSGERLGPYEIVAPLGAGGMGEVYKARDTRLGRTVAVKILPPTLAADAKFRERFDREARTISSLDHPHICALHDVGEHGGLAYLVMQFVEGETLADLLRRGALPRDEAFAIASQIAGALETAHERGIVHRDLKPGNVIVSSDGAATVLDFGLAKDVTSGGAPALSMSPTVLGGPTRPGVILGTAAYMAPEQARGLPVDKRADIWAFGCVLFEMLTGRPAFRGDTVTDIVAAVVTHEPDWSALPPATPSRIRELLRRCLVKDPKRRLRDIGDARLELEDKPAEAAVQDVAHHAPARARVAWPAAVALAAAAAAVGVLAAIAGLRGTPRDEPSVTRLELTTPPTSDPGSFALSPDGRTLAFVATTDAVARLWVRPLDQAAAVALAATEGATQPFWSPDGRAIGFFADGKLKRIDRAGGSLKILASTPFPRGGTWSRDGVILFSPNAPGGLMQVSAEGGPVTVVTQAASVSHRWPQFFPDGRLFLFYESLGPIETRGVYLGSLDGSEPTRLMDADAAASFAPPDRMFVVRQGALDVFRLDVARRVVVGNPVTVATGVGIDTNMVRGVISVSPSGVLAHRATITAHRQLVWTDRTGRTLGTVGEPDEFAPAAPMLAPDGRRVAMQQFARGNVDVWVVDTARGIPTRFTFDPTPELSPVWSPDSRRIAFESSRGDVSTTLVKAANATDDARPLLATPERKLLTDWSPDGRTILYQVFSAKAGSDVWALPVEGDRKPFPVATSSFDEMGAQFSPDGRWIAYSSNASGRDEIYVRPFAGSGDELQVSRGGGAQPRWSRDGRELFYVAIDGRMTAVPITVGRDGRGFEAGAPVALFPARLATGANIYFGQAQYAVASDGRFLLNVSTDDAAAPPISVVLNWDAALKK